MGVYLKAKYAPVRLRDGENGEMKTVGAEPVWFENLELRDYLQHTDIEPGYAVEGDDLVASDAELVEENEKLRKRVDQLERKLEVLQATRTRRKAK